MWSTRTLTPFLSHHSLANLSYHASYAGMKWLHCNIRRVDPLICAGAWRASSIVSKEPVATPDPAVTRNFLRSSVARAGGASLGAVIGDLLRRSAADRGLTISVPSKELNSL